MFRKIKADIEEIKDVLTTEKEGAYLGSEIDMKVNQSDFDLFKNEIKKEIRELREQVLEEETWNLSSSLMRFYFTGEKQEKTKKTTLEAKLMAIEKFLGIEYKKEEKKFEGYKRIKAKNEKDTTKKEK